MEIKTDKEITIETLLGLRTATLGEKIKQEVQRDFYNRQILGNDFYGSDKKAVETAKIETTNAVKRADSLIDLIDNKLKEVKKWNE